VAEAPELLVAIDRESSRPLYRQLYDALREAIVTGRLAPGQRVPSSRVLAAELGVSRNTVMNVLTQLRTEGYVVANRGGGTRVRRDLPDALLNVSRSDAALRSGAPRSGPGGPGRGVPVPGTATSGAWTPGAGSAPGRAAKAADRRAEVRAGDDGVAGSLPLSRRGAILAAAGMPMAVRGGVRPVPFKLGVPDTEFFPSKVWARLAAQRWRRGRVGLGDGDSGGEPALRAAIAEYVGNARGVRCGADQVIVVSGTQQALDLVARVLLDPGDEAWVEDPGYPHSVAVLRAAGARPIPVPVDREGLVVKTGEHLAPGARFAYVTPSHQFPLGSVMSIARRMALLAWARGAGAWIFEDDYDSEFRYEGRPLPSLQGLDVESGPDDAPGCVVYAGTFNKMLFPGLRLGYIVVPEVLVDPLRAARAVLDRYAPMLHQGVLADFIGEGHYVRHLRRMRALYAERQAELLAVAGELLERRLTLEPDAAGLHLVGWLPRGVDDVAAAARARGAGVVVYPLTRFRVAPDPQALPGALLLGYAPFDRAAIRDGVRRLATALADL